MGRCTRKCNNKAVGEVAVEGVTAELGGHTHTSGVRTRARALAMTVASPSSAPSAKRMSTRTNKVSNTSELRLSERNSNFVHEFKDIKLRGAVITAPEKRKSDVASGSSEQSSSVDVEEKMNCDSDVIPALVSSCCSTSNDAFSSLLVQDRGDLQEIEDPEVEQEESSSSGNAAAEGESETPIYSNSSRERERRETTMLGVSRPESIEMDSTEVRISESNNNDSLPAGSTRPGQKTATMPTETEFEEFFAAAEENLQKRFKEKYNFDIARDVPLKGRYEWIPIKP